jgi:hypothetical protein
MPREYNHYGEPICEGCNRAFVNDRALDQHYLSSNGHAWCQRESPSVCLAAAETLC